MRTRLACLLALPVLAQAPTQTPAQDPSRLTLESLFHPARKVQYVKPSKVHLEWLPDGALVESRPVKGGTALFRVDPATGESKPLFEAERLRAALTAAGAPEAAAREALDRGAFTWSEDRGAFLLSVAEDLYLVRPASASAKRLTRVPGAEDEPTFSPDGRKVAFLRGNDLYAVDVATARETRLTHGGSATVFNGRLDWVYQEELYGRGDFRAFWWAPDSKKLAYLQLDETKVPVFTLMDDRTQPQRPVQARYPKAGDPNPTARLGVVDLQGRTHWTADPYPGQETLIVQVGWDPAGRLLASWQDRVQTWLELRRFDKDAPASRALLKEQGPAWQERLPLPRFLPDGGFLWESDRTGHHHVYRCDAQGRVQGAVTEGPWDVRSVHGFDPVTKRVFFEADERSPLGQDAYAVGLDGRGLQRLTEAPGTHKVRFNRAWTAFLDRWSDARTPGRQGLFSLKPQSPAKQVRLLEDTAGEPLAALKLGELRFQRVPTRDGGSMESELILPPDFDPAKKYPVFQHVYGGPAAPQVKDAWNREVLWFRFLAQQGVVVWICDNRSASNQGLASAWPVHRRLGQQELRDQLDGLAWLKGQGWADMDRVCLEGWSYGGYMTAYALTHAEAWKCGVIGAPVTDWRLYDSIYTERYMGRPQDNPEGYEAGSVLKAAAAMRGRALLLHGTLDDNVHPQNSVMLMDALQKADRDPLPTILLPGSDHGGSMTAHHAWARYSQVWDFLSRQLF